MSKSKPAKRYKTHWSLFGSPPFDQAVQSSYFHRRSFQINPGRREKIKRMCLTIEKPFTRRIQFFENVFHESNCLMHGAPAIVLPAAFFGDLAIGAFAGDAPGE